MSTLAASGVRSTHSNGIAAAARTGLAARGVVYLLMGAIALEIATGHSRRQANQQGAFAALASHTGGTFLLALLAAGLAAYAIWRFSEVLFGTSVEGDDAKPRAKSLIRGVAYAVLCVTAVEVMVRAAGSSQDRRQSGMTAQAMRHPGGRWLVGIAGLVILGVGVYFIVQGIRKRFVELLDRSRMSHRTQKIVTAVGAFGTTARGVVVGLAGGLVVAAAVTADPGKSTGLDGALRTLSQQPYGPWLLGLVALGLIAFGVYAAAEATWSKV